MRDVILRSLRRTHLSDLAWVALMVAILKMDSSVSATDQRWLSWLLVVALGMLFCLLKWRESPAKASEKRDAAAAPTLWHADGKTKVTL
jgi:hypothetical protein